MTRYIDADALKQAIPPNVSSTLSPVEIINTMINAAPTVTPPAPPPNGALPAYRANKALVFDRPYSDASYWSNGRTSAYPGYGAGAQTNAADGKLDYISTTVARPSAAGVFTASKSGGFWITQLVTTEGSLHAFRARTGDVIACDITVNATNGAWPALWTWAGPGAEVDCFEYHGDNPTTLEFTNHVGGHIPDYPKVITPGQPAHLGVVCGANSVLWYVDGVLVYSDGVGVGPSWSAYLIANLSVAAGNQYHPGPDASQSTMSATIANVKVYR